MISRIEILTTVFDSRAEKRKKQFGFEDVYIIDVYSIDKKLGQGDLEKIGSSVSNPVTQKYYFKSDYEIIFDWAIEIGFLPGVTDNVAHTVKQIAEDLLKIKFKGRENVYSSQLTLIKGKLDEKKITRIANSLYNPLIQRVAIKNHQQFVKDQGMDRIVPKVSLTKQPKVNEVDLEVNDEELVRIGKTGIANPDGSRRGPLALDLRFMKTIKNHFRKQKRNPTDVELESLAQTWSEHCKHTIFNDPIDEIKEGLFAKYIKGATEKIRKKKGRRDFCVSVFKDNSGAIIFDDKYLITHKIETHNSPSALDPYGGAVTGIVGVNRDAIGFGLGAKPVANFYGYCLADPRVNKPLYKGKNFTQTMLSSSRIMSGVRSVFLSMINVGNRLVFALNNPLALAVSLTTTLISAFKLPDLIASMMACKLVPLPVSEIRMANLFIRKHPF